MLGRKVTASVEKNYSDKTEDGVTPVTTLLHFPVSDVVIVYNGYVEMLLVFHRRCSSRFYGQ